MAGQTIMSITYGIDVLDENDPYLASSERSLRQMSKAAFPGRYLVVSLLVNCQTSIHLL